METAQVAPQQRTQEPSFTISDGRWDGVGFIWQARPGTRSQHELHAANHEDGELIAWLGRAAVGAQFMSGGGAGAAIRIERVS